MKRLTRPKNNKVIAGVCAGIANYGSCKNNMVSTFIVFGNRTFRLFDTMDYHA